MTCSAQVVLVIEEAVIAAVRGDMYLRRHNVINFGAWCASFTDDGDGAEWIEGKDVWPGALAPGGAIVKRLESGAASTDFAIARGADRSVVRLMSIAISTADSNSGTITTNRRCSIGHMVVKSIPRC